MEEENVVHGVEPPVPTFQENAGKFIYQTLTSRNRKEVLFINDETGEKVTCQELIENSSRLAQSFCAYNVIHDKVIALCSENHVNYFTTVFGALFAGVPIVFINPNYTEYELQHALNVTKPDMIFCSSFHLRKFIKLKASNRYIRKIVTINSGESTSDSDSFEKFINQHSDKELASSGLTIRDVDIRNHTAFILFSSGTTGLPKGVMLTHLNVNAAIASLAGPNMENQYGSDTTLGVLPFFHIFGLYTVILAITRMRRVVVLEKFEPELYLKYIQKYKVAILVAVPPLVQFLLKNEIVNKYDLSSVKEIICGAAPLGKELAEAIKKKLNLSIVRNGYGMTESGLTIAFPPLDVDVPGSVGTLLPGMSCVIKDITTRENLGPNQTGEICIRGEMVTNGYYKNEEATKDTITEDGWLKTGDVGYYDENGLFYIVDRIKELIKHKGFQVAPAELEQLLLTNPKIQDAGVIGLPDSDAGELPLAFVVKQSNMDLTENEVHKYVAQFVSHNKQLHGGVIFVDAIPRNPSGKILRRKLKEFIAKKKSKL